MNSGNSKVHIDQKHKVDKRQYMPGLDEAYDQEELQQMKPLLQDDGGALPNSRKGMSQVTDERSNEKTTSNEKELLAKVVVGSSSGKKQENSPLARVKVFNEDEETTKIIEMRYLTWSCAKRVLVVPFLTLLTGFFFLLFLYWYPKLRKKFLYSECNGISKATHLYIVGTSKQLKTKPNSLIVGHSEIVEL